MAKASGITAYSHAATDRSFNNLTHAEKIGIYGHVPHLTIQLFIPHGTSKYGDKRYSQISVEIAPTGFRQVLHMMCEANLKSALEAMSSELADQLIKLPITTAE